MENAYSYVEKQVNSLTINREDVVAVEEAKYRENNSFADTFLIGDIPANAS